MVVKLVLRHRAIEDLRPDLGQKGLDPIVDVGGFLVALNDHAET